MSDQEKPPQTELGKEKSKTEERKDKPEQQEIDDKNNIKSELSKFTGPQSPADLESQKAAISNKFQNTSQFAELEIGEESKKLLQNKMEEEQAHGENELKRFMNLNREKRNIEIDEAILQDADFKFFENNLNQGWKGKGEIMEKINANPEMVNKYKEFRNLKSEQLTLKILPQLENEIPGLDYFVTKSIATEMGPEIDQQILIAVVEPSPKEDPEKKQRIKILQKLIELGLTNSVALGEKFSGNSEKHAAFLDFVFIHQGEDGIYKSIRPEHDILDEEEREVVVGEELPDNLNTSKTFKEIAPENFSEPPSFPEHFRDDVIYNGIYLQGPDLKKKLDFYTNQGELTEQQEEAINKGIISKEQFFTPEQAKKIKQTRIDDLQSMVELCRSYYGQELLDEQTLNELAEEDINSVNFDKILGPKSGAEIEKNSNELGLQEDKLPEIKGLSKEEANKIFNNLLQETILGYGQGGKTLKNELFAFPDKAESSVPITILANQPKVITATQQIENNLRTKGISASTEEIHTQVVEFMKKAVSDFKRKGVDEYWGKYAKAELLRK